jgi:hypothetical protein
VKRKEFYNVVFMLLVSLCFWCGAISADDSHKTAWRSIASLSTGLSVGNGLVAIVYGFFREDDE